MAFPSNLFAAWKEKLDSVKWNALLGELMGTQTVDGVKTFTETPLTPNRPAFMAWNFGNDPTSGLTYYPVGVVVMNTVFTNVGSGYNASNGRFTAPVAGTYAISFSSFVDASVGSGPCQVYLRKNGSNRVRTYTDSVSGTYQALPSLNAVLVLAASDYIDIYISLGRVHSNENAIFSGYFIG